MITFMIPVFNRFDKACETIDSLLSQEKINDFKILISDDLSTDGTYEKLVNKYSGNDFIQIVRVSEKKCVGHNRNNLIKHLNTDYGMFIDSDDIQSKSFVKQIQENILLYGDKYKALVVNINWYKKSKKINSLSQKSYDFGEYGKCLGSYNYIVKKSYLENTEFLENIKILEDGIWCFKYFFALCNDEIKEIPVFYNYYIGSDNSIVSLVEKEEVYFSISKFLDHANNVERFTSPQRKMKCLSIIIFCYYGVLTGKIEFFQIDKVFLKENFYNFKWNFKHRLFFYVIIYLIQGNKSLKMLKFFGRYI